MKFSTQQDVQIPVAEAFEMVSSFGDIEAAAIRRGAEIRRVDDPDYSGVGMKWHATFSLQGRGRTLDVEMVKFNPTQELMLELAGQGLLGHTRIAFAPVSAQSTQVTVDVNVRATTLAARLLLQPLKLTKSTLDGRFQDRVAQYIKDMEQRYAQSCERTGQ